ncbi:hypothetical protein T439DRAFT_315911 [Meredithblackwellia eburnea MCA 4105]
MLPGGGSTVSVSGFRLPLQSSSRKPSLLGWPGDSTKHDKRSRRSKTTFKVTPYSIFNYLVGFAAFCAFYFYWYYELHIEIQVYSKGWIKTAVLATPPPSSTCFDPARIEQSLYNKTLASAPAFVDVHAGMRMATGMDCFNFAATLPESPTPEMVLPKHTIFHAYWRADLLPLSRRQVSLLHSLLAMQDRESTSVILWTNADVTKHLRDSPLLTEIHKLYGPDRFEVREINKKLLAIGTPLEGSPYLDLADRRAWIDGDLVRILVLWEKGGIWVDMDTIMTGRDMRVLGESEWVTQWDCYDKVYQPLNGAMMHFYQHSPYLCEMMHVMSTSKPPRKGTTDWGSHLYHKVWRSLVAAKVTPFKILPYCFTDGHSCRLDNRLPNPFASRDYTWGAGRGAELRKKVESVWAVHLHNQWDKQFPKKGWVRTLILEKVRVAVDAYRRKKKEDGLR